MPQYAFYIDTSACSGCKACQAACHDKNNTRSEIKWRRVYEIEGGNWEQKNGAYISVPFSYFISMACNNCNNPVCVKACPTTAMHVDKNGITVIDTQLCIGCRYCEWACPYNAPQYDPLIKTMTKCNLCEDYLIAGKKPACADACPMRALDFGTYEEMSRKYGGGKRLYPLPEPDLFEPGIIIKPHRDAGRATNEKVKVAAKKEI